LDFKDFLIKKIIVSYFLAVTGITAAIGIIGSVFAGDTSFGYQAFLSPFLFGLVAVVPSFVTYSRKELSVRQMICRLIIHLFLLEALILLFALITRLITSASVAISIFLAVLIIDVTVRLIHWLNDKRIAGELNKALREMQHDRD
jgi:hypothetical protein